MVKWKLKNFNIFSLSHFTNSVHVLLILLLNHVYVYCIFLFLHELLSIVFNFREWYGPLFTTITPFVSTLLKIPSNYFSKDSEFFSTWSFLDFFNLNAQRAPLTIPISLPVWAIISHFPFLEGFFRVFCWNLSKNSDWGEITLSRIFFHTLNFTCPSLIHVLSVKYIGRLTSLCFCNFLK